MEVKLKRTNPEDPDFIVLTNMLDQELWDRIHGRQAVYVAHNILAPENRAVVAEVDGKPVACGAFRYLEGDTAEIKRMYVRKDFRGMGISKIILKGLETWAKEECYLNIILETGSDLPEAVSLYKKSGYKVIENYGPYIQLPRSICMKKEL
jgi:putative acetyltransferase